MKTETRSRRWQQGVLAVASGALIAGAALYGIAGGAGNAQQPAACAAATATVERLRPLARGELAAFQVAATPRPIADIRFQKPDGTSTTLAEHRGRVLLINLWATWCAPCRHEMPALDALQGALGGPDFEVVAINIDQRNLERPKTFLAAMGVKRLAYYADPSARVFQDLKSAGKAFGMPTTILVDRNGCELGVLAGAAEWAGADAKALISAALARS
jgi:thiol-disulfide isomerase/thioredoxin